MVIDTGHIDIGTVLTILTILGAAFGGFFQLREGMKRLQINHDTFVKRLDKLDGEVNGLVRVTEGLATQTKRLDSLDEQLEETRIKLTEVIQKLRDFDPAKMGNVEEPAPVKKRPTRRRN